MIPHVSLLQHLRAMLIGLLTILGLAYVGFAGLLFLFQHRLAYYPEVGRELRSTPREHGMDYEAALGRSAGSFPTPACCAGMNDL